MTTSQPRISESARLSVAPMMDWTFRLKKPVITGNY